MESAIKRPFDNSGQGAMLNELRILSHPPLCQHPNIIDIVGRSIKTDNDISEPLLVVEASSLGDLSSFWACGSSEPLL